MDTHTLILCEPQCHGFEHVQFNAALLLSTLKAFPASTVFFLGESSHLDWVSGLLKRTDASLQERIRWQACEIPPRHRAGWLRLGSEKRLWNHVFTVAEENRARAILLSSITTAGLLTLKRFLFRNPSTPPVHIVFHSLLKQAATGLPLHRLRCEIPLRPLLRQNWPASLRGIALGESILNSLIHIIPQARDKFDAIDHPYLWDAEQSRDKDRPAPVRFGYFGVRMVGLRQFYGVAGELQAERIPAQFVHVGFLHDPMCLPAPGVSIEGLDTTPLSTEAFAARARSITYAVWLSAYEDFRLVASGTFLDALAHGKPGIYLRSPYIEYYFERLGDIGYLCGSLAEVKQVMADVAREFPSERYKVQQENIFKGRELFSPETVAEKLRAVLKEK